MDLGGRGNRHGAVEWRDPASGGRRRMGPEWAAALERGRWASVGRSTRTRAERSEAVPVRRPSTKWEFCIMEVGLHYFAAIIKHVQPAKMLLGDFRTQKK